jgi:hypothetical protein
MNMDIPLNVDMPRRDAIYRVQRRFIGLGILADKSALGALKRPLRVW